MKNTKTGSEKMTELTKIDIYANPLEDLFNVGDEISTTTSEFPYNSLTHCFDSQATYMGTVLAKYEESDYSEYDPDKCNNGGCYGYDYYTIVEVLEREY